MAHFRLSLSIPVICALAACGSGGSGDGTPPPSGTPTAGFLDDVDEFIALGGATSALSPSDPATIRTTGSANYDGIVSMLVFGGSEVTQGDDLIVLGDLDVTVSFVGSGDLNGSVTDFADSDGDTYSGGLSISGGDIDRTVDVSTTYTFAADIGGTITNNRTNDSFEVRGEPDPAGGFFPEGLLLGDFYGTDEAYIQGVIRAFVDTPDGTLIIWDTGSQGTPDGEAGFIAEN